MASTTESTYGYLMAWFRRRRDSQTEAESSARHLRDQQLDQQPAGNVRVATGDEADLDSTAALPRVGSAVTGIVVETIAGGCGGVQRDQHAYPNAARAEVSPMGELVLLSEDGRAVQHFAGGSWVNWRPGTDAGPSRTGSC